MDIGKESIVDKLTFQAKKNNFLAILSSMLLFIFVVIVGFFAYQTQKLNKELIRLRNKLGTISATLTETELMTTPTIVTAIGQLIDWQTYTDTDYNFIIKYPKNWSFKIDKSSPNFLKTMSFGPGTKEFAGSIWGINVYEKSLIHTKSTIIREICSQFKDCVKEFRNISVNGIIGVEIVATTATDSDWYLETVIFEDNNKFYVIKNGAISDIELQKKRGILKDTSFKDFYSSFEFVY